MKQERENEVVGSLMKELREIEEYERNQRVESENRSITADCTVIFTIICC